MERKYLFLVSTLKPHVTKKQKAESVWGEVEEGTGKEKITIFAASESRNKTALRQSSVLALVVKTKYIYCSAAVTMHHGMVTKSANKIFL